MLLSRFSRVLHPHGVSLMFTIPSRALKAPPSSTLSLKEAISSKIPSALAEVKEVKERYGDEILGQCTVKQAYGGMRAVRCMTYETSLLDTEEGIRFRGLSIEECQKKLPKADGGKEPLPEGLLWLLMTGDVPSDAQVRHLRRELAERAEVPQTVKDVLESLPKTLHPMSQLAAAVMVMQEDSVMAREYSKGTSRSLYWEHCLEDTLTLLARLPEVAARIYRRTFKDGTYIPSDPYNLDMGANYARMMGFDNPQFDELMRLYLTIHTDHEGGNVSAHAMRLVGSALSDPYLAFVSGLNGLAGPLHGLANQECLKWLNGMMKELSGGPITKERVRELCWKRLNNKQVLMGFGHAVLRKTDPRYMVQRRFALEHLPDDEMFGLVSMLFEVAPQVLLEQGKISNPYPNVDAHSGVLLQHYGLREANYYTVMFAVSRAIGPLASLIWDRIFGLPIERPKSMTTGSIKKLFQEKAKAAAA